MRLNLIAALAFIPVSAIAQEPSRKYDNSQLEHLKNIFKTVHRDPETCAIRLYSYGNVPVVIGAPFNMIAATVIYTDGNGNLTNNIAEYIIPTALGGSPASPYNSGHTYGTFNGTDARLKYSFSSVPPQLNVQETYKDQGERGLTLYDNWRLRPGIPLTLADVTQQCGPQTRFCECIYDFPR